MSTEFVAWPKTPRLYRDAVITEKIDGTNAAVVIESVELGENEDPNASAYVESTTYGSMFVLYAQSRKRIITPENDNYGFSRWVRENASTLAADLGPGRHFGEWWGQGIQRGYGLDHKRFSLFNTKKWELAEFSTPNLYTVPVIFEDVFDELLIKYALSFLRGQGSYAARGFMNPEGVCVYHTAANAVFKVLLENDDVPKSAVA